jgi:lipoic acid synthetase
MQLQYVVITSVTRDDLPRGGAEHFARTIAEIRKRCPGIKVEVLIPDFEGDETALERLLEAGPDVVNHNVETVPRLYPRVRPGALYTRSLALLSRVKRRKAHLPTKSGLMLGLGESDPEIRAALHDLVEAGCGLLTLGQYLQPTPAHLPVDRYLEPEAFDGWRRFALELGFSDVASGPLVRSSYEARALFRQGRGSGQRDEKPGPQKRGISGAPCPEETPCEDI